MSEHTEQAEPLLQCVNPNDLTEHPEAHRIPEMTADEWAEFSEGVRIKKMITAPVFALRNGIIFDGRHRLRAAKEHGIKLIPVIFYDITEDEALERMRQEAVDQRHLTLGQRVMINLEFGELVGRLRAEAKERQTENLRKGNVEVPVPAGLQTRENKSEVAEQIAQLSGTSARNVYKAQAVIREAPDLAEKIKSGEITINKAESELKKRKQTATVEDAQKQSVADPKLAKLQKRDKPKEVPLRTDESPVSPSNRLGQFVTETLTPFIDDLLGIAWTSTAADEKAREPFIKEMKVLLEASFRILADLQGEEILKTMEEISDDEN